LKNTLPFPEGCIVENQIFELQYAMDTFYFLVCGALVMWMAAGFAMLEAGLVRAKNTTEILTKNVALFAISCIMYLVCGYAIMYGGDIFLSGIADFDLASTVTPFTLVLLTSSSRSCSWRLPCPSCLVR
jgi:Amt family ammonium transporter